MVEYASDLQTLLHFLTKLEQAKISFRLDRCREESILVRVDVPGERWEVEFFTGGEVEVERFGSTGHDVVGGQDANQLLTELLANHSG